MQMGEGNDKYFIFPDIIDDPVWEPFMAVAANAAVKRLPSVGILQDFPLCGPEFVNQAFFE